MKPRQIYLRRMSVLFTVYYSDYITFNDVVAAVDFSRNEVAHHLSVLEKHKKISKCQLSDVFVYKAIEDKIIPKFLKVEPLGKICAS